MKRNIDGNPEFGYELACTVPYAYYLHINNMLGEIRTVKDMKPFYYFANDVKEVYNCRSVDNLVSLKDVPNNWLAHNSMAVTGRDYSKLSKEEQLKVNGVLDYREWVPPPFKEYYSKNNEIVLPGKTIMICNKYCMEHGAFPRGYFDSIALQEILEYLTNKNYTIIYKRPENTEFALDINEQMTTNGGLMEKFGIKALDENNNEVSDKQICKMYKNVYLIEDLLKIYPHLSYNTLQLKLFCKVSGFIAQGGGSTIFPSFFNNVPIISYITTGCELRDNFFNENSFYKKLSGAEIYPIRYSEIEIEKHGCRDYTEMMVVMKEVFK